MESVVDLASIPSTQTSSEETEETESEAPKKKARIGTDPDEVTSSLSGSARQLDLSYPMPSVPLSSSAQQQDLGNPIPAVPLSSAPPAASGPPRMFGLSR